MMQLEDYFNFLTPNDIRLKGTRIGIETILYDYIAGLPRWQKAITCAVEGIRRISVAPLLGTNQGNSQ